MTRRQRRLVLIGVSGAVLAVAVALVLSAMRDSIVFFHSPTEVAQDHLAPGTRIRIGGLVKPGSLERGDNLNIRFDVTDGKNDIPVRYQGIVPDLFREGRAWWRKASSGPAEPSSPTPCWPSTMSVTCRARSSTR
jgi:cytochrome c-type biogenesis protein CcmE